MKIWGKLLINNRIVKDKVVLFDEDKNYEDNLKNSILEICKEFDIEIPYWLPSNEKEYAVRKKTIFTQDNFIDEFKFDKFVIEEIDLEDK